MGASASGCTVTGRMRWWRFSGVGLLGAAVQLLVLHVCLSVPQVDGRVAVAIAVGAAVVHNFVWHRRWTWGDRGDDTSIARQFARFVGVNGGISVVGNVLVTSALVDWTGVNPVAANLAAIGVCSLATYLAADRAVFRATLPSARGKRP